MLNDQDHAEKHLRALHRELTRLKDRRRHPPVHELKPPIQRGWKRHFVLTPSARSRPDAETLAEILACLNTVQYFWRPDFRLTQRQLRRRRGPVATEQELLAIHWSEWDKEPVPPAWRKYFRREFLPAERLRKWSRRVPSETTYPRFVRAGRQHDWGYEFRFPWWFELKVEKHWLTHYTEIELGVAGRIAEIERWLDFHRGRERFQRLKGVSSQWPHFNLAALRRDERRTQREMRAHLGFLGGEAADHIPSIQPCGGHGGWDVLCRHATDEQCFLFFAAVRLEILRLPNTRHETRQSHRIPALWARVVGPVTAWIEPFPRRFTPRHLRTDRVPRRRFRRCRPTVQSSSERAGVYSGRLSPQNTPGCARHGGLGNFSDRRSRQ